MIDLHPFASEGENQHRPNKIFVASYTIFDPCPPPPQHGVDLQLRLGKFDLLVREADLNFITAFRLEIQERSYCSFPFFFPFFPFFSFFSSSSSSSFLMCGN